MGHRRLLLPLFFAGLLSGLALPSGAQVTIGAGQIQVFSGDNPFNGGAITFGGDYSTLAGQGGPYTVSNPIILNGTNIIDLGNARDVTFSGNISGSGGLRLVSPGAGAFTFTGNNTFSWGTFFPQIDVSVGGSSPLGTGEAYFENGSILRIIQNGTTLSNPLGFAYSDVDLMGHSAVFSGPITLVDQGVDIYDTVGGGVLQLSGPISATNIFSVVGVGGFGKGPVTLQMGVAGVLPSAGALYIGQNATFDMNGYPQTISKVNNSGTLKTGGAALSVNGDYTAGAGSNLTVTLTPGAKSLQVSGTATLTGETLTVSGHPAPGAYTVVQAGAISGTFTSVDLPAGVKDIESYTGTTMTLDILSSGLSCANPNQNSIANALNSAPASADMTAMMNTLSAAPSSALEQMSPASLSQPLRGPSYAMSKLSSNAVNQRVVGLQAGEADGSRVASYNVSRPSPYPGILVAELPGDTSAVGSENWTKGSPWGFFATGVGTLGRLNDATSNSGLTPGYSFHAAGAALGADYRLNDNTVAGFTGGYAGGSTVINDGEGSSTSQSIRYGVYGALFDETRHVDLQLGGASDFFDVDRAIPVLGRNATSSPTGQEFNTSAHAGFDLKGDAGTLSPFASLSYDRLMINAFNESGAGSADLAVEGQNAESLRSGLGAKVSRSFKSGERVFTPYLSAGWQHEYMNQSQALRAQFAGGGGVFTVQTADVDRDGALLGAGVSLDWSKTTSFKLAYAGDLRPDFVAHTFSGTARFKF